MIFELHDWYGIEYHIVQLFILENERSEKRKIIKKIWLHVIDEFNEWAIWGCCLVVFIFFPLPCKEGFEDTLGKDIVQDKVGNIDHELEALRNDFGFIFKFNDLCFYDAYNTWKTIFF